MTAVFANLQEHSLVAVEPVDFANLLLEDNKNNCPVIVDLKQVVLDASLGWVVRLFRGKNDKELEQACFRYWKEIRKPLKQKRSLDKARKSLDRSLQWDTGILQEMATCDGMSLEEATENAAFAMIAALDAVQSIVFWTLWNLARKGWGSCREEILGKDCVKADLALLAAAKKDATQGKPVTLAGLSYLGRALLETVRVYPPIWTLPRRYSCSGADEVVIKLDIPSTNGALQRDWDPNRTDSPSHLASFGLGKRHCPAGTGALFAAYVMIRRFVCTFPRAAECDTNKALNYAYLGPTLCVQGPQLFGLQQASSQTSR
jgi:cytochrome P450